MRRSMVGVVVLAALGFLVLAAPVAAFPLSNCSLSASAERADGSTIDSIANGGDDATQAAPFLVDWDGTVSYSGAAQVEMKSNKWHIDVFGIPTPLQGGDDNPKDDRDGSGNVSVSANAPFRFTGLYYVSGELKGSGGTCSGSGWFKLTGDPIGTIPFFVAAGVLIVGLGLLGAGARGHTFTSVAGGLLSGLGLAAMLVLFSTLPFGYPTPIVVLLIGLVLGIVVAAISHRGTSGDTGVPPPPTPTEVPPAA